MCDKLYVINILDLKTLYITRNYIIYQTCRTKLCTCFDHSRCFTNYLYQL